MKNIILFVAGGLLMGLAGGGYISGSRERDVILERMAQEKAAAEDHDQASDSHSGSGGEDSPDGPPPSSAAGEGQPEARESEEGAPDSQPPGDGAGSHKEPSEEGGASEKGPSPEGGENQGKETSAAPVPSGSPRAPSSAGTGGMDAAVSQDLPPEGPIRLAKIFGAMEPKDAAAVLQNLNDGEIQAILLNMSDRKVAEILEEFEPERAATLSRVVLDSRPDSARR